MGRSPRSYLSARIGVIRGSPSSFPGFRIFAAKQRSNFCKLVDRWIMNFIELRRTTVCGLLIALTTTHACAVETSASSSQDSSSPAGAADGDRFGAGPGQLWK